MTDLRRQFFTELLNLARQDKKIMCLTADLGFSFKEEFEKELPEQILNVGIAENNMIGIACGMAIAGKKTFCYSGGVFLLSRANEFIRDDVCYNNLNVKIVATGANGFLGFTHNFAEGEEDSLLKSLPNIKVFKPKDNKELIKALTYEGCAYIRL